MLINFRFFFMQTFVVVVWLIGSVKSGNFGHQVNSDTHLQTVELQLLHYEPSHQDFHCLLS